MSTLNGERINRVELHIPRWGSWWARVSTQQNAIPTGPATLAVGDLILIGTVLPDRAGENAPNAWSGIVQGGAGWDTVLPARTAYQIDGGILLSTVLKDLAADCGGLALVLPTDRSIGAHWARARLGADRKPRKGRDELAALLRGSYLPGPWWVDPSGVTRFGGRISGPVTAEARVLGRDLARGMRLLGVDSPAAFLPGGTFEDKRIERIIIHDRSEELRLELWES